ncbi:MAG: C10 family peptidase [Prevotella sp.]|nr:C10 family peptidase [Prevotella sp.]
MKKYLLLTIFAGCAMMDVSAQQSVEQMVNASWHQSAPFNGECPNNAAAGCGAIAVAQILNYYKMPQHGFGHVTYEGVDIDLDARSIDWQNILDSYSQGYSQAEGDAVASLVFQVGAAMKINYGSSSSPYNYASMMWGLQHYLHFSPASRYRNRKYYSTAEWIEMLNSELEQGHPVFYRGDHTQPGQNVVGHMYVIDGRDSNGNYHFNFGHASQKQDKFTDLNIINQGDGIWPGVYSVSYHHRQAMVTDFYPVDGLTDGDFDHTALVLNSPLVLENQPYAQTVKATESVQAKFQFRYISFEGGSAQFSLGFYQDGTLVGVSKTVRNTTLSGGGNAVNIDRNFILPDQLPDGDYEMSVVSRDSETDPWVRGWDNAPNCIPVSVKDNTYTFTLPNYHTLQTRLYLTDDGIKEITGGKTGGKTLEMTVCNSSDNNFEDSLRLVVTSDANSRTYEMPTSIYEGQMITYRFFVADSEVNTNNGYTVEAYYKETNTDEWILLQDYASGVHPAVDSTFDGLEIFTIDGKQLKKIAKSEIDTTYHDVLANLHKGIYIIRDKNGIRKFIKQL